jgi:phosphatidylinositol alpha-mannosyltransferase
MRIAMYHFSLPQPGRKPGGVEVFVDRLADAMEGRGHEVEMLTYSAPPSGASYGTRRLRPHSTETRRLLRQYGSPWLLNFRSFKGFDVAHFHGDDWFFFKRPLPVVRTFHGSALLEATSATSLKRRLDKALVFPLELLSARLATGRYGVGADSEIIYRTQGLLNLGIDPPSGRRSPSAHPTILFIGTWRGRKRGSLIHEVFQREIRATLPDAELWMISDECPTTEGVRWIQAPSDAEVADLMNQAWAFCLPSSYEGFGIPYLEAMSHGVPVVATPNPGSRLLLAGDHGVLADESELGRRLIEILSDESLREGLAAKGLERASEYSWDEMGARHEQAYEDAIERWGRRRETSGTEA